MTNSELIDDIIGFYKTARKATAKYQSILIKRGRNHTVSSLTEDLLSSFITKRCPLSNHQIWIDYPISYKTKYKLTKKGNDGSFTMYPDISIVRLDDNGYTITCMIDLKMDLGWKRNLQSYCDDKLKRIEEIRVVGAGQFRMVDENGIKSKLPTKVNIANNAQWIVPVISDQNITNKEMNDNLRYISQSQFSNRLKLYVFTKNIHPNNDFEKPTIDNIAIDSFVADITSLL